MNADLVMILNEMRIENFEKMSREDQVLYLTENLRDIKDDLVEPGIEILIGSGETELAISLARDSGRIDRAVEIAVADGDYLWAALIAKKAGREEESVRLYREGLEYYVSEEKYGRAVSAAQALGLPYDEIDHLFEAGVRYERRMIDMDRVGYALESLAHSLNNALVGRDDEMAEGLRKAMAEERERIARQAAEDLDE
ncbi:MAG: hypothetical protein APR56_03075 [Methanosaeta sp. SDB]|uniref:Two component transcriptional regulator n=1 Tax=Methanothrix harundinacea TaxID=301375 RepID=A0A101IK69_9EURY|nr:MAG: hypothetical protein APR56_03075 [Methanosaeta sp. SDB]KUK44674.1 MAG: Two component transcriptional regulator [Methanothrix harundinacea]KUK96538.1 MAG: Two component transcriptional regulator [Methanothrix harundinacea]